MVLEVGVNRRGESKRKRYQGEKSIDIHYMYMFKGHIMKPTKHCKRGKEEKENWNIVERVNLFKMQCMHVWNYHKETPSVLLMYIN
jgi:hypothetical protein